MNIGFDAKRAFNNHTGLGNYARFVINTMIQYYPQHEYFLFTPTIDNAFANYFKPQANLHIITPNGIINKTFSFAWLSFALTSVLKDLKIDVYHGLSNELPIGIERTNIKSIVTIHDLIFLRYPAYYKKIDAYIYKKKFNNACINASKIVSVSQQTKSDIVSYFNINSSKVNVVFQDCDRQFYTIQVAQKISDIKLKYNLAKQFFISVGTIEKRKNQLNIIKAIHSLNNTALMLVIIGRETDYKKEIDDYILQHNLQAQILFLPKINFEDLPALYQASMCAIYISEFEGFGIPVLEAMRSGVPVIASNVSSMPEVGGDAVLYALPNDVSTLSIHIKNVNDNAALRQQLIDKGKQQAQKINPQLIAKDLMQLYQ